MTSENEQIANTQTLINKVGTESIRDGINDIFNALVIDKENAVLPENLFVTNFLPFFAGERDIKQERQFMSNWIGVAGSPTREVDIIDTRGQVLYTVPSLFNTNMIETVVNADDTRLTKVIMDYEQTKTDFPIPANDRVGIDLHHKLKESLGNVDENMVNQTSDRWNQIFDRYNLKPKNDNSLNTNNDSNKKSDLSDEFEYD